MSFHISQLDPKKYLTGAMVMGFFLFVDAILALNNYRSTLTTVFSLLEIFWFIASLVFLLSFKYQKIPLLVPLLFVSYFVLSYLYGSFLLATAHDTQLVLPFGFVVNVVIFACIYLVASFSAYKSLISGKAGNK